MKFELLHPRDQLVNIINRIYHNEMTTLSGGNLSIQDDCGNIWITPAAVDKGRSTPKDIVCIRADGTIEGLNKPSSEHPFHRAIYNQRPDLRAIVHAHSPALVSFSIARLVPDTNIIPHVRQVCGPVGYAPYALTGSEQLGDKIAATFGQGYNVVLLENHGIATGGSDLLNAFQRLETLDFYARTLIKAKMLGPVTTLSEEQLALNEEGHSKLPSFIPDRAGNRERELRQQIVDIVHRAYDRYLMTGSRGIVSARLDEHSFLITPTGLDRRNMDIEDIVLIQDGQREEGKLPSRSVYLHQAIYHRHPQINCIMSAQPPNATAYTISSAKFHTKTIPESYIMLRDIPVVPYGTQYQNPEAIAETLSPRQPVLLIQNDGVITSGSNILQTFDRLEVAEYSAKSLIETTVIGELVPIGESEIRDLEIAFSLAV